MKRSFMSGRLKKKFAVVAVVGALCLGFMGYFLFAMQTRMTEEEQGRDIRTKAAQLKESLEAAKREAAETTEAYDDMYQSKSATMAYMFQKKIDSGVSDGVLKNYRELLNVNNVLVLDEKGAVIAQAEDTPAEFTYERYNQLRTVFTGEVVSDPFEVELEGQAYRYYGAKIDDTSMAVIEQKPGELKELLEDVSSWKSILSQISVGMNGYAAAVSARDYTFIYHPEEQLVGTDALTAGISVADLEDGSCKWMEIDGERFYCGVAQMEDVYVLLAVPEREIAASRSITVGVVLFVFFAVLVLVIVYAMFTLIDKEEDEEYLKDNYGKLGGLRYNRTIGRKVSTMAGIGLLCLLVVSFYMQTLFAYSRQSMSNDQRIREIEKTIDRYNEDVELLREQYNTRYLNKCRNAAYILERQPELQNREDLSELSRVLDVEHISVFDKNGAVTATNSTYTNFKVSQDEEDQSYDFYKLLVGGDYVIQEAQPDEVLGIYRQYVGVALWDEEGNPDGFVQIAVTPSNLEDLLENFSVTSVLDGVSLGSGGFAFAVEKENGTFAYYPNEKYIGKETLKYGMQEKQLRDGYSGYITIDTEQYFGTGLETEHYYIYVAEPVRAIMSGRLTLALVTAAVSLLGLLIICLLLVVRREVIREQQEEGLKEDAPMVDVVMPDGSVRKTESAVSRWSNVAVGWRDQTPEQRLASVLKGILAVLAVVICIAVVFREQFFDGNSIFLYVINGTWERGVNIFSLTACILLLCVGWAITLLIQKILKLLARTFNARGETICRLLRSLVKYASVIILLYYCLALFGVDTKTLLASAGILSMFVALGSKTLVADILAGLFIIFEGEFRVGDIVTVGDWRGTVMEIGIRTTKIQDPGQNVKIISNSSISGVINMTRQHSFAACDFAIEYGESLERVESILEKELPKIQQRVPSIQGGPFYKGVTALGDSSVNIKIVAQCAEADRIQLMRDLNREVKLIFDRYDINIPFPQVVVNQPAENKEATAWQKHRAEEFNKEQKELSKELEEQ